MDASVITCNEITGSYNNETKTIPRNFYILLAFSLITIALLIAVSIYCYLIKYQAKQKHLSLLQFTNNKSKMSNKVKDIDLKNQI